jgi:hypothetical protein
MAADTNGRVQGGTREGAEPCRYTGFAHWEFKACVRRA